jgi:hypothetical protein
MPTNSRSFALNLRKMAKAAPQEAAKDYVTRFVLDLLSSVVRLSPVNTGRLRNSWQVTLGSPSAGETNYGSVEGVKSAAAVAVKGFQLGEQVWIQNGVPYAYVIEKGLYDPPDPGPSKGLHVPKSRRSTVAGQILVRGGFHVSAPEGMLMRSLSDLSALYGGIR